jgi:hypothetical protein
LEVLLNAKFPPSGSIFKKLEKMCQQSCLDGWLCAREAGGIKFGRVIKPCPESHAFSIDMVEMDNIVGPYQAHPNGGIDMVMPTGNALSRNICRAA